MATTLRQQQQQRHRSDGEKQVMRMETVVAQLLTECDPMLQFMAESPVYDTLTHAQLTLEMDRLIQQVLLK